MRHKLCLGQEYREMVGRELAMNPREESGAIRRCSCAECRYLRRADAAWRLDRNGKRWIETGGR